MSYPLLNYINTHKKDAVEYKAVKLMKNAGDDIFKQSEAVESIKSMLACIQNSILVESYIKRIAPLTNIKSATLTKSIKDEQEKIKTDSVQHVGEGKSALPKWVDKDRLNDIGFDWRIDRAFPDNTGMYFPISGGHLEKMTNFVMKPIVHIVSQDADLNRRITEMDNGRSSKVFELPSKAFITPDSLESILLMEGHFFLEGLAKPQLNKLKSYYLTHYPMGYELTKLGWQKEGFFAFSNMVYHNRSLIPYDAYGMVEIEEIKYLSMGASNILQGLRQGQANSYTNDKQLTYVKAPISFKTWTGLILDVYEEKGMMLIAWALLAINRDIVGARTSYCPIPYCYGAAQSGKSQYVNSLIAIFFMNFKIFNLNQGTEFAFWEYNGRFHNTIAPGNEFDVQTIDEKRSKAYKGIADFEGRARGTGRAGKAEMQEATSLPVLLGQYLAVFDDNALLGRSIALKFVENNDRPEEQVKKFNELKEHEAKGLTSLLCEILDHRDLVNEDYHDTSMEIRKSLKADFAKESQQPKNRVLENYTSVLTLVKLYEGELALGFTYDEFYIYCKNEILKLNNLIGESNSLGEFWRAIEQLSDSGMIEAGWDYKIESATEVKSILGEKDSKNTISFDKPTRLLFIRLKNVYPVFAKEKKIQTGKQPIGESTVKSYLIDQPYYIGASSASVFRSKKQNTHKNTSCMVINYDILEEYDINLDRAEGNEDPREQVELEGFVERDAIIRDVFGVQKVEFMLFQDKSYSDNGFTVKKEVKTKCFLMDRTLLLDLQLGTLVRITGLLSTRRVRDVEYRDMEVHEVEILKSVPKSQEVTTPPVKPFPTTSRQLDLTDQDDLTDTY